MNCVCGHPKDRHDGIGGCCTKTTWLRDGKMLEREQFCGCRAFAKKEVRDA